MQHPCPPQDAAQYHDEAARAAFDLYTQNGSRPGDDLGHWLEAERHVQASRYDEGYTYTKQRHGWLAMVPVMTAHDVSEQAVG